MTMPVELKRILSNASLVLGVAAVACLIAIGAFGLAIAPYDPNATAVLVWHEGPAGERVFEVPPTLPSPDHLLGTDALGRDQWSRILSGAWLSLGIVIAATAVRFALGVSLGALSGWQGGLIARFVGAIGRGVSAIPPLILAILLVLMLRPLGVVGFIVALALVGWPEVAEYVDAEARRVRRKQFVEAARSVGASDGRIARTHLFAAISPQLLTLGALELSSVLVLLAELGLIGLFVGGATFLIGDFGRIDSPLMGRTPEWGQMLGAIQFYAISGQLGTLLPAVVMVVGSASFVLLADGLRSANDPYSPRVLRPGTFGALSRGLVAALCISAIGLVGVNVAAPPLTMETGRETATKHAERIWPGSVLVAGVARYISPRSFERPDRLTYYFRSERGDVLRISYENADRLASDIRPYESQDDLEFASLRPLPSGLASYEAPAIFAEEHGGNDLRVRSPIYRVLVTWPAGHTAPVYEVRIGKATLLTERRFCCFDAKTGAPEPGSEWQTP